MNDSELLLEEINNSHSAANDALKNRMFEKYINLFGENLEYKQLNGKIIGKNALVNDIKFYFNRVLSYTNSYERKSFTIGNDIITEDLIQHIDVSLRVFVFFSKNWKVQRRGIYTWMYSNNSLRITRVEILEEKII
jgi:hypothetical protein